MRAEEELSTFPTIYLSYLFDSLGVKNDTQRILEIDVFHRTHYLFEYSRAEAGDLIVQRLQPSKLFLEHSALSLVDPLLKIRVSRELINAKNVVARKINIPYLADWLGSELNMRDKHPSQE